jgi:hypothetical protein
MLPLPVVLSLSQPPAVASSNSIIRTNQKSQKRSGYNDNVPVQQSTPQTKWIPNQSGSRATVDSATKQSGGISNVFNNFSQYLTTK